MNRIDINEYGQFIKPYYSTIEFEKFLKDHFSNSKKIIDIGCGLGGTLSYYVKKYPNINFIGTDYRFKNILLAKKYYKRFKINNN